VRVGQEFLAGHPQQRVRKTESVAVDGATTGENLCPMPAEHLEGACDAFESRRAEQRAWIPFSEQAGHLRDERIASCVALDDGDARPRAEPARRARMSRASSCAIVPPRSSSAEGSTKTGLTLDIEVNGFTSPVGAAFNGARRPCCP
jgi:hypothetical protein